MEIVIHFIVSTIATFAFAKLFNAPTKELLYCGITAVSYTHLDYVRKQKDSV